MALRLKLPAHHSQIAPANPLPTETLLEPLPPRVVQRFPELADWQTANESRFREMIDALNRRQQESDDALSDLRRRIAALES